MSALAVAFSLMCLVTSSLTMLMQLAFTLVELGCVRKNNVKDIVFRNVLDTVLGAIIYYACGFAFSSSGGPFIGQKHFFLADGGTYACAFLQAWVFAQACGTIPSGAMAERATMLTHGVSTLALVGFIQPVVAHWMTGADGWLVKGLWDEKAYIDCAGSVYVHCVGGIAAAAGAYILEPRIGRFGHKADSAKPFSSSKHAIASGLGVLLFWPAWLGFNMASITPKLQLLLDGANVEASSELLLLPAVNTTISAAFAGGFYLLLRKAFHGRIKLGYAATFWNSILSGMVAITAGCFVVRPWAAVIAGILATLADIGIELLFIRYKIDDAVGATAVHLGGGLVGALVVALFAEPDLVQNFAGGQRYGGLVYGEYELFVTEIVGTLVACFWAGACSFVVFKTLKHYRWLRVSQQYELQGLDISWAINEQGSPDTSPGYRNTNISTSTSTSTSANTLKNTSYIVQSENAASRTGIMGMEMRNTTSNVQPSTSQRSGISAGFTAPSSNLPLANMQATQVTGRQPQQEENGLPDLAVDL